MNTTAITPFQFESKTIRTIIEDGKPLFVAIDVAEALGYRKPKNAVIRHCKGALNRGPLQKDGALKRGPIVDALGRTQEAILIHEPDVYRLIVGSQLPSAQRFERWLFEEVLPTIRRTGSYVSPTADPMPRVVAEPSWEQCERCEDDTKKFIWTLQGHLLSKDQLWNDIRKYHAKGLNNKEIGKLVGLGRAALRRQMRAMEECGLLCPRSQAEATKMRGPDLWHKYAIPVRYGLSATRQGKQLQLFPVGAIEGR